jgi:putative inorganic carbon (hco3(-)) transporter
MVLQHIISIKDRVKNWLDNQLFAQKFNNPLGYLLFTTFGLVIGSMIPYLGIGVSSLVIGGIVALPMVFACMFYHQFGIIFTLILAFFVQFVGKLTSAPIGTSLDGLMVLMVSGILISQVVKKDWSFAKDPISSLLLFWIYFNIFQVLNPSQESKMAWLFTVRSLAILNLLYFIACFAFSSLQRIKQILNLIVILATVTALYGLKQEFGGFSEAEKSWIYQDPERFQLFFQWGRMRTFSLFNDAMTFGVMMAYMGVFCFIYATGPMRPMHRGLLILAGTLMFWSSIYTGTRTCFALIPMGLAFYAAMTLKKEIFIGFGIFLFFGAILVFKGGNSNPVLFRVKSAFEPSNDASVQIRYFNQKRIRPYIYSHPIGFGPGSTGLWARRFTPDSFLAKFAHDSYYVRLAVELGWIGLALYMYFFYTVLRRGLYFYLRVRDPSIKILYLSILSALFMLAVANYPQEAIVQLPTSLVSYVFFAAIVRLKDFDPFYQSVVNGANKVSTTLPI